MHVKGSCMLSNRSPKYAKNNLSILLGVPIAQRRSTLQTFMGGKNDKIGETINSEHRSYELMKDLQLGIRWSVSKMTPTPASKMDLDKEHFAAKVKVAFPHEGSRETPPHKFSDFRWKDYCPKVFEKLRSLFVVDPGEYMLSICGEQALRELSSPGKSGALFYISHDDRYLIKTMRRNEMKTFISMLPYYFDHVQSNPHTLVTKFYGLYRIKLHSNKSNNRKVLHNVPPSPLCMSCSCQCVCNLTR